MFEETFNLKIYSCTELLLIVALLNSSLFWCFTSKIYL